MSRVVFVVARPVWPTTGGGQLRSAGLIGLALDAGHEVLVVQPAGGDGTPVRAGLSCVEVDELPGIAGLLAKLLSTGPLRSPRLSRAGSAAATRAVRAFAPDVAVLAEVHAVTLRSMIPAGTPLIYDNVNVEAVLYRELARNATTLLDRVSLRVDQGRIARAERKLLREAEAVTGVSQQDLSAMRDIAPMRRTALVPSSVPTPLDVAPTDGSCQVLFLGSLDYPPNTAAVEELVIHVLPAVRRQVPEATLLVAGRRAPARLRRLLEQDGCLLREDVATVSDVYLSSGCMALPIRSGSGTRLKVYECLAHGVPLVATARAVEGVPLVAEQDFLCADTSEELADAVVRVLTDAGSATRLATQGRRRFVADLAWNQVGTPFVGLIAELSCPSGPPADPSPRGALRDRPKRSPRSGPRSP